MSKNTEKVELRFTSFNDFYPFYLSEHRNSISRRLHFTGSLLTIGLLIAALTTQIGWLLAIIPLVAYGCAWVGHFFFEHNTPATFKYPLYSLMGDWVMFRDILFKRIPW